MVEGGEDGGCIDDDDDAGDYVNTIRTSPMLLIQQQISDIPNIRCVWLSSATGTCNMLETGIMLGLERGRRQLIKEAGLEVGQQIQKSTSTNKPQDCPSNPQVIYEKKMFPCDACDNLSRRRMRHYAIKLWKSKQHCGVCKKTWFYSDDRNGPGGADIVPVCQPLTFRRSAGLVVRMDLKLLRFSLFY